MKLLNINLLIVILILSILSFLIPNHYVPWLTAYQDFSTFLSLILLVILLFKLNFFFDKNFFPLMLISLIPIFQFLLNKIFFFGDALIVFIYLFGFSCAYLLGLNLTKNRNINIILNYFSFILIFSSIISIYIILKQWLLLANGGIWIADLPPGSRPFANFAQPNNCSTFLCMGLMATLYLHEKRVIGKLTGSLLTIFLIFAIVLTQSRTSWVFILLFFIWWFWKTKYFETRLKKYSIFYFFSFFVLCVLYIPYIANTLGVSTVSDAMTRASTGHLRIPMWQQMLYAIKEQPMWGYGWNQVSVAQITNYLAYPTTEWIEHSHNILLDLLIWNGIPLGLIIIGFFVCWMSRLSLLANCIENFIVLSMIGAVLVHAMFEFPLTYAFFLLPVGFLIGVIQATDTNLKAFDIPRKYILLVGGLSIILYVWIFVEYKIIEKDVELVRFESLNIGDLHAEYDTPNIILLTQLREQIRFIRTKPKKGMSNEQLDWMRKVAFRYGTQSNLYRYAQALALNNQPELAKKYLLIIEQLYGKKYSFESLRNVKSSLSFEWGNQSKSKVAYD